MSQTGSVKVTAVTGAIIIAIVSSLLGGSYIASTTLGFPYSLRLPLSLRVLGGAVVISGLLVARWTVRLRRPGEMIRSTYVTFTKVLRRTPLGERGGRKEQLVIDGPHRYVRSPLYLGVVVMVFGFALLTGYSYLFVATVVFLLWFSLVLIPLEERELQALFGDDWKRYSERTPMIVPFTKRRSPSGRGTANQS